MKSFTKSWKTTVGGLITALGLAMQSGDAGLPDWLQGLGHVLQLVGPVMIGIAARDSSVSSEAAGAKK